MLKNFRKIGQDIKKKLKYIFHPSDKIFQFGGKTPQALCIDSPRRRYLKNHERTIKRCKKCPTMSQIWDQDNNRQKLSFFRNFSKTLMSQEPLMIEKQSSFRSRNKYSCNRSKQLFE